MMTKLFNWFEAKRWRYFFILLWIAVLVRLPSLFVPVIDADEAMYATAARGILNGLVMYRDIVDQKPPLIYYLFSLIMMAINDLRFVHFMTIFLVWATAVAIYRLITTAYDLRTGMVAGILYVVFISTIGQASNTEMFLNLPMILAVLYFLCASSSPKRYALLFSAAIFIGIASLVKQQGGLVIVPLGIMVIVQRLRGKSHNLPLELLVLLAGTALPYIPFIVHYWYTGALNDFITWAYINNLSYVAPGSNTAGIIKKAILIPVISSNLILWWYALRRFIDLRYDELRHGKQDILLLGILWLLASFYAVSMGHRWYTHYFIQLTPALIFLAAPTITDRLINLKAMGIFKRVIFLYFLITPILAYTTFFAIKVGKAGYDCQKPSVVKTSRYVKEHTKPNDYIFTWGSSIITYLADRPNASRFVHCAFAFENRDPCYIDAELDISEFSRTPEFKMMMSDLKAHKPMMFVDTSQSNIHCWEKFPVDRFDNFKSFLDDDYVFADEFGGLRVYRRISP